jgi:hypothetical protein
LNELTWLCCSEACKNLLSISRRLERAKAQMIPRPGLFITLAYRRVKVDVDNDDLNEAHDEMEGDQERRKCSPKILGI